MMLILLVGFGANASPNFLKIDASLRAVADIEKLKASSDLIAVKTDVKEGNSEDPPVVRSAKLKIQAFKTKVETSSDGSLIVSREFLCAQSTDFKIYDIRNTEGSGIPFDLVNLNCSTTLFGQEVKVRAAFSGILQNVPIFHGEPAKETKVYASWVWASTDEGVQVGEDIPMHFNMTADLNSKFVINHLRPEQKLTCKPSGECSMNNTEFISAMVEISDEVR